MKKSAASTGFQSNVRKEDRNLKIQNPRQSSNANEQIGFVYKNPNEETWTSSALPI